MSEPERGWAGWVALAVYQSSQMPLNWSGHSWGVSPSSDTERKAHLLIVFLIPLLPLQSFAHRLCLSDTPTDRQEAWETVWNMMEKRQSKKHWEGVQIAWGLCLAKMKEYSSIWKYGNWRFYDEHTSSSSCVLEGRGQTAQSPFSVSFTSIPLFPLK